MESKSGTSEKNVVKAGVWYTVSSISVKAMAIITTPIYTRLLSTVDYGVVQTFTTWYSLLLIFCSLNFTWSVGRAKQDFPGKLEKYIGNLELFSGLFTILMGFIVAIAWPLCFGVFDMSPQLMALMFIYLTAGVIVGMEQSKYRFQYKYKENIAITVFIAFVTVAVSICLILVLDDDKYVGRIIGCIVPTLILGMYFAFSNIKAKNWGLNREFIKYGIVMSVPLIFHSLALNILAQSDRLVIAKFCSASDVGVYSLAYQYAILVNIFLNAINEAWLPWFQDQYVVGNFIGIKDNVKSIITFGCFLSIGCAAVAPEAILILGGKAYESGIWAVPPILMGLLCQFLYTRYVHIELQEKKTSIISTGTMIAALLNLVLNFMFIPKYGFVAAGYTTLFSYIVLFVIHFLVTKLLLKINLYDDLSMIVSMLVGFALICGMAILYNHIIIRYVCILIITVVYLLTNKDVVMKVLGKKIISKFK